MSLLSKAPPRARKGAGGKKKRLGQEETKTKQNKEAKYKMSLYSNKNTQGKKTTQGILAIRSIMLAWASGGGTGNVFLAACPRTLRMGLCAS